MDHQPLTWEAFSSSAFFRVEVFDSLAGKQAELFKERELENAYLKRSKRPDNFIFVRDQGAALDLFKIGAIATSSILRKVPAFRNRRRTQPRKQPALRRLIALDHICVL